MGAAAHVDPATIVAQRPDLTRIAFVASGGQKAVYSAVHPDYGRVALKIFAPGTDVRRATREVEAVRALACREIPRICETFALATAAGPRLSLLEEWIDGESLRFHLQTLRQPMAPELILSVARDCLAALRLAESSGIVHRDVKPENILLRTAGARFECCLTDFGIARHRERSTLTASGGAHAMYTPGYAPPEQFNNLRSSIDGRADLFALGVTLYECAEGTNPFRHNAADDGEVLRRVKNRPLPPVARPIDPAGQFADLVHAMTRPKRCHRLATVAEADEWIREIAP
jgi:eukaryotic-like serine/threonine-protein kinase